MMKLHNLRSEIRIVKVTKGHKITFKLTNKETGEVISEKESQPYPTQDEAIAHALTFRNTMIEGFKKEFGATHTEVKRTL
jgi:hypothetical protein